MKFIVLGKYTKQGTDGWLDNPDEDRRTMLAGLSQKIGGKLLDLSYTRGIYDVVAIVEAPSANIMTSLKLAMMKTGAIAELCTTTRKPPIKTRARIIATGKRSIILWSMWCHRSLAQR